MVTGKRYTVSTQARSEPAAVAQLRRFEADPEGDDPRGHVRRDPIYLDVPLAKDFLVWSRKPKREGGRGNTPPWVHDQKMYLDRWAKRLRGVDLRRVDHEKHVAALAEPCRVNPRSISRSISAERKTHPFPRGTRSMIFALIQLTKGVPPDPQPGGRSTCGNRSRGRGSMGHLHLRRQVAVPERRLDALVARGLLHGGRVREIP